MQKTPQSERTHIAFFGRCNSGKSSLINALTGQSIAVVSEVRGTTTDPVSKAIELPGIGASVLIDTPGYDDNGVIIHNGTEKGYLYIIDEPITVGVDIYQHPRTTMDENAEFLTKRPLKVKMIYEL